MESSFVLFNENFDYIIETVKNCGDKARDLQTMVHRSYKKDGTVLTEADLYVSDRVEKVVKKYFPNSNFITEESLGIFSEEAPYTFILDPIDGTDAYSQGLPSWAVSLGVLDQNRIPVAGEVYAPRFGVGVDELLLVRKMGMKVTLNGEALHKTDFDEDVKMIAMEASSMKVLDFSSYTGNFRIFGSAVLHMVSPVIFMHFEASVHNSCYVWDVAGPHSILKGLNLDVEYYDGSPFVYDDDLLISRNKYKAPLFAGSKKGRNQLRQMLSPFSKKLE
ncbi:MAG: inositol monophosphatase [Sphaerochaetaceae bacterium]|nr:inositol monophosphatase [Sphaerochaetaceae bacterium]